jgi:hypothetical protein
MIKKNLRGKYIFVLRGSLNFSKEKKIIKISYLSD